MKADLDMQISMLKAITACLEQLGNVSMYDLFTSKLLVTTELYILSPL